MMGGDWADFAIGFGLPEREREGERERHGELTWISYNMDFV
jgi:hypothetical protein